MGEADLLAELYTRRSIPEEHCRPRQAGPMMNQGMEVADVLQVESYNLSEEGKVPIIKNWVGREGLQSIQSPINTEKEACKSTTRLFDVLKK